MNANATQAAVVNQRARQPLHDDHPNSKSSREGIEKTQSVEHWGGTELVETEIGQTKQDKQVTQTNYILTAINSIPGFSQWKLGTGLAVQDGLRETCQSDPNHETWITAGKTLRHQCSMKIWVGHYLPNDMKLKYARKGPGMPTVKVAEHKTERATRQHNDSSSWRSECEVSSLVI